MPIVTLTVQKPKSAAFKDAVLAAVHRALVASGVPQADLFHRVLELEPENFRYDASYPDLASPRTADFVMIEILLSVGRSVKIKKKIVADLVADLAAGELKLDAEHVMLCFKETSWENWSFGGGRLIHT
jgi:phenylpyruvate tautomerase PptA (4-oxalocrotonate tautomerase family)